MRATRRCWLSGEEREREREKKKDQTNNVGATPPTCTLQLQTRYTDAYTAKRVGVTSHRQITNRGTCRARREGKIRYVGQMSLSHVGTPTIEDEFNGTRQ